MLDTSLPVRLLVGGDVFPDLPQGPPPFRHLAPLLSTADVVAANCEGVYCDDVSPAPTHRHLMVAPRQSGAALAGVPIDVLSCANNHAMDSGAAGLFSTMSLLQGHGITVVGAGANSDEARMPVVVVRRGVRIAFVAFCSVFPKGYEARPTRAGVAALRVETFYSSPDPNFWEPGIAPRVSTVPMPSDLELVRSAIERARRAADVVVVLAHWGYSSRLSQLQEYELILARDAVDHGADVVACCHHHSLRGVEFYRGRPIFYGLGALVHHMRGGGEMPDDEKGRRRRVFGEEAHIPDPAFPYFPFHETCRMSGMASVDIDESGLTAVGFFPARILPDGATTPLRSDDPFSERVWRHVSRITAEQGFATNMVRSERDGWSWFAIEEGRACDPGAPMAVRAAHASTSV